MRSLMLLGIFAILINYTTTAQKSFEISSFYTLTEINVKKAITILRHEFGEGEVKSENYIKWEKKEKDYLHTIYIRNGLLKLRYKGKDTLMLQKFKNIYTQITNL